MVSEIVLLYTPFNQSQDPQNKYPPSLWHFSFECFSPGSGPHSLLTNCNGVLKECGPDSNLLNKDPHVICI